MIRFVKVMVCLFALIAPAGLLPAQTVIEVNESSPNWTLGAETGTPTFGFADGPGTPPYGTGSVQMHLVGAADGVILGTDLHNGLRLSNITILSYATYQDITPQAIALQFNLDYDDTDADTSWQGRLVYEPYFTHTVLADTWQTCDTLDNAANGNWWSTGTPVVGGVPVAAACIQSDPCTWAEVLAAYPNAGVHSTLGALLVKAGSGWPAFNGAADAIRIAVTGGADVLYDLETQVPVELMSFSVE